MSSLDGSCCTFLDYAGIRFGESVTIGPKATLIVGGHAADPAERSCTSRVHPSTWRRTYGSGAGARILPGVSIGRDAVITADVPAARFVTGT